MQKLNTIEVSNENNGHFIDSFVMLNSSILYFVSIWYGWILK